MVVRLKKYHLERSQVFEPATGRFENLRPFKFPSTLSSMPRGMVDALNDLPPHLPFRRRDPERKRKILELLSEGHGSTDIAKMMVINLARSSGKSETTSDSRLMMSLIKVGESICPAALRGLSKSYSS